MIALDTNVLVRALAAFHHGAADFSDYLIREHAEEAGAESVATFDKALHTEPGFVAA